MYVANVEKLEMKIKPELHQDALEMAEKLSVMLMKHEEITHSDRLDLLALTSYVVAAFNESTDGWYEHE